MSNTTFLESENGVNVTCLFASSLETLHVARVAVITIITLVTYFGNTLILLSIRNFPTQFKCTFYVLIGNLAAADLLLAIGLTIQLTGYVFTELESNAYFCVVKTCITSVSIASSAKLLLAISLDRFAAIMCPMKHFLQATKKTRTRIKLSVVWVLSITVGCFTVIVGVISSASDPDFTCSVGIMIPYAMAIFSSVFIPLQLVLNVVLCVIVAWSLRTNIMSKHQYRKCIVKCGLLIKIYIMFGLSWAPFIVTTILAETNPNYQCIQEYLVIPGFTNSAVNWIVYGLTNKKMRTAFKNCLQCRCQREYNIASYLQPSSGDKPKTNITGQIDTHTNMPSYLQPSSADRSQTKTNIRGQIDTHTNIDRQLDKHANIDRLVNSHTAHIDRQLDSKTNIDGQLDFPNACAQLEIPNDVGGQLEFSNDVGGQPEFSNDVGGQLEFPNDVDGQHEFP